MENIFLLSACDWFTTIKAPDLLEKVNKAIEIINAGNPLEGNYKKLVGFILFDYSMHQGPPSFEIAAKTAELFDVTAEFVEYALDWMAYSNRKKAAIL
jgi:hypothetical protein